LPQRPVEENQAKSSIFFYFRGTPHLARVFAGAIARPGKHTPQLPKPIRTKVVYLDGAAVGAARTWHEVALLLSATIGRPLSSRDAQALGNEGPDGFYVSTAPARIPPRD